MLVHFVPSCNQQGQTDLWHHKHNMLDKTASYFIKCEVYPLQAWLWPRGWVEV